MKKLLWICNTPLPDIQNVVGIKSYQEGWLVGLSNQIRNRKDIDFYYAFPQYKYKRLLYKKIAGINFLGFYNIRKNLFDIKQEYVEVARSVIKKINPDIIHIFGTELPHSLEWVYGIDEKEKIIVSIQGVVSKIASVYLQGIPFKDQIRGYYEDGKYLCLRNEQNEFYKRGINEQKLLKQIKCVIGRTNWDRKFIKAINSQCKYYHCGEILRDSFYEAAWDILNIQRYSIFISQAYYPIKGLHILIDALSMIKKRFPEVIVYVAGDDVFSDKSTPYGKYICRLIKKNHVSDNIIFLGKLTEQKMKKQLLKTHIMLMPSLIENSPNSIGEAALLGVPTVAASVGGIPCLLKDGEEGYLYPALNKEALAKKICTVFDNDSLALLFSHNGKERAKKQYDRIHNGERLLEIYNRRYNENI